jgi:hypothetical protein
MLKTTSDTLVQYTGQIPITSIPNTYKDAFIVARSIGVQHLWIDSLCIIQDDELDWHFQSAEMASIYRNACLTIAAADSYNSDGGCFREQQPSITLDFLKPPTGEADQSSLQQVAKEPKLAFHGKISLLPSRTSENSYGGEPSTSQAIQLHSETSYGRRLVSQMNGVPKVRGYVRRLPFVKELVLQSPLSKRAWTFQETTLSKRVLYFTRGQLIWRCQEGFRSEDGYIGKEFDVDLQRVESFAHDDNMSNILKFIRDGRRVKHKIGEGDPRDRSEIHKPLPSSDPWWEWVHDYSSRSITYSSDKYAAFAGITVFYQDWKDCSVIAKLRTTHFPRDLL